ncbi:MAG: polyketide synthase dehydratase domain-containing protein [Desulfobacterales bacterium]
MPIQIPVRPDLFDHRFEDRPVYPAVEAMEVLAGTVRTLRADAAVDALADVRFDKFLPIPDGRQHLSVFCDVRSEGDGIRAEMQSRVRLPSGFTRNKIHASARFEPAPVAEPDPGAGPRQLPDEDVFPVSAERLYRELVPFGKRFQTLIGDVALFSTEARAVVRCPEKRPTPGRLLGNSFVLDGAFHAACAWGQRFAGVVAFPVGIDKRRVLLPTRAQDRYSVRVLPTRTGSDLLVFAIEIADDSGKTRERLEGVRMRDVSGGRWKPPDWIKKPSHAADARWRLPSGR